MLLFVLETVNTEIRGTELGSNGLVPAIASCKFDIPSPSASAFGLRFVAE
jgi:hypothetical protein